MIVFVHVQRTAGSSIHAAFRRHFADRWIVVSGWGELPEASRMAAKLATRDFYIGGHVGIHELREHGFEIHRSDVVFSVVRDPVERAISLYFLMQRQPEWFGHIEAAQQARSFEEFYDACREKGFYFRNDHCRLLSNSENWETTRAVIGEQFGLVGCVSRLTLLEQALQNVVPKAQSGFKLPEGRINAAWHGPIEEGGWIVKVAASNLMTAGVLDRVRQENESDTRLLRFIEEENAGLFIGRERSDWDRPTVQANPAFA